MHHIKYIITGVAITIVIGGSFWGVRVLAALTDNQIIACVKKDGVLHVIGADFKRDDCNKKETLLSWNIAGIKGDTGERGPAGGAIVYDAQGKRLGNLIGLSSTGPKSSDFYIGLGDDLFFEISQITNIYADKQATYEMKINPNYGLGSPTLYFELPDCTFDEQHAVFVQKDVVQIGGVYFGPSSSIGFTLDPQASDSQSRHIFSMYTEGACSRIDSGVNVVQVKPVTVPFALPINGPLHIRY